MPGSVDNSYGFETVFCLLLAPSGAIIRQKSSKVDRKNVNF